MSIDFDKFLGWAESRFDDVVVRGDEVILNSIFCDDSKRHLWCNPSGGKTGCETGVYHCWKSDKSGSLVGLVMIVDKCPYEEALEKLGAVSEGGIEDLERRVREIFEKRDNPEIQPVSETKGLELPPDCHSFDELPSHNPTRSLAMDYLKERSLPHEGLLVCTRGRYRDRIIIPYRDRSGRLIYYNGRYIGDPGKNLRYLGPPKELGVGKGDVAFFPEWPRPGEKVYVTEGEFDAISLHKAGFMSVALGGKNMTERQHDMLKEFFPVLCFDADSAGGGATASVAASMMRNGTRGIRYVRPCSKYKDWNAFLVSEGPKIMAKYVEINEKDYDHPGIGDWESTRLRMNGLVN